MARLLASLAAAVAGGLTLLGLLGPGGGTVGRALAAGTRWLLGDLAWAAAIALTAAGAWTVFGFDLPRAGARLTGLGILAVTASGLLSLAQPEADAWTAAASGRAGGVLGYLVARLLSGPFGPVGRLLVVGALIVVGTSLTLDRTVAALARAGAGWLSQQVAAAWFGAKGSFAGLFQRRASRSESATKQVGATRVATTEAANGTPPRPIIHLPDGPTEAAIESPLTQSDRGRPRGSGERPAEPIRSLDVTVGERLHVSEKPSLAPPGKPKQLAIPAAYRLPSLDLLQPSGRIRSLQAERDLEARARLLEEVLASFGVTARVSEVHPGPTITRFELQLAPGIKVSKVTSLADDLALNLASPDVRIEAPIPGKSAIGIEVPNREVQPVLLREVLTSPDFQGAKSLLTFGLGKNIAGQPVVGALDRMPHLLIAGATGSGKSVCLNTIIASLLFRATPQQLKFLMIDPKMVELTGYNGIPHLIAPVVTDPRKAAGYLRWAVREMESRYQLFVGAGVRDFGKYNELMHQTGEPDAALPFVVVIIDELADLMMVASSEVEEAICRLAQMARAAGIHLIVATQRPSVDVITGLIKANIPSRIAFAVASQVDSRTILDGGGAERLLGKGDMLFHPVGMSKPLRVQGAYVSEREIEALLHHVKAQGEPEFVAEEVELEPGVGRGASEAPGDELLGRAVRVCLEHGQASVSILQRRLKLNYSRAVRLIDEMEERGLIGPHNGPRPRELRITAEDYARLFGSGAAERDD